LRNESLPLCALMYPILRACQAVFAKKQREKHVIAASRSFKSSRRRNRVSCYVKPDGVAPKRRVFAERPSSAFSPHGSSPRLPSRLRRGGLRESIPLPDLKRGRFIRPQRRRAVRIEADAFAVQAQKQSGRRAETRRPLDLAPITCGASLRSSLPRRNPRRACAPWRAGCTGCC
jgi:hypothetical protein